jgi:hypothetical protein
MQNFIVVKHTIKYLCFSLALFFYSSITAQVKVIPFAHSHNDYTRKIPLHNALENGFLSVEVDVFYRDGKFLVAHTILGIRKHKTIEALYLKPLKKIVAANNGKVYTNSNAVLEVMIDTKGSWTPEQLRELESHLLAYKELFVMYENCIATTAPVKVLLSGGGYLHWVKNDNPRLFSVDAGMGEIASEYSSDLICRNSAPYSSFFKWKGRGTMPENEKEKLQQLCKEAKEHNRKIRFWGCPNNKNVWRELLVAGAGWINVDKLEKFQQFYWVEFLPSQPAFNCCPRF